MPANTKYLTTSRGQRFAKISAAILGSYLVTMSLHLAVAAWFCRPEVIITSAFSAVILWAVLMAVTFLSRNGWKIWALYLLLTAVFLGICYAGPLYNTH